MIRHVAALLPVLVVMGCVSHPRAPAEVVTDDALVAGFRSPPHAARPQVWWHWMNGNIDAKAAVADLEWAAAQGIGGVHLFEGGLGAAQVVDRRLPYMSPEWQDALRASVAAAKRLKLDVSIATSPGWSSTGAPWVEPAEAMKKLVWSETTVAGGERVRLSEPPHVSGPYLDVPAAEEAPSFYRDVAVLAFPAAAPLPRFSVTSSSKLDAASLGDGRFGPTVQLLPGRDGLASITYRAVRPVRVQAVRVGLPAPTGFGAPPPPLASLESSIDGVAWRHVAELAPSSAPARTASFPAVTARWFRLVVRPAETPDLISGLPHEPGATQLHLPPPPPGHAVAEFGLFAEPRIGAAEVKAGFAAALDYGALHDDGTGPGINPKSVVDLTDRLRSDGVIDWTPPAGRWTVMRFGMSLTGHHNGPAPAEATGLEVDKLSAAHVSRYLDRYIASYDKALEGANGIDGLLSDSIEAGAQNWTDAMPAEFARRRGYALMRYLPALAGHVVGNAATSDAFLHDFRSTITELLSDAYYGTIAAKAAAHGMTYYAEALEDHRPQLGDDLAMRSHADVPVGAMWFFEPGQKPRDTLVADLAGAASVAHVLGRPLVGVEAISSFGYPWALSPARMRATADRAFLVGGNRLMLHSMVHQAAGERVFPGQTLIPQLGHNFNRNEAWAPYARGWTDYLSRSQFLLQQGAAKRDFAYFTGEDGPVTALFGDGPPLGVPSGFSYDFVDPTLVDALDVRDGRLVNRSGGSYAFLYLGGSSRLMTLGMLSRLDVLARKGVVVAGVRPAASPSLSDAGSRDFRSRVDALWRLPNVVEAATPAEAIATLRLQPSWNYSGSGVVDVSQRDLVDGEIYLVVNKAATAAHGTLRLSRPRLKAQWWDAVTGSIEAVQGRDVVVDFLPNESRFLVVRDKGADAPAYSRPVPLSVAEGPWNLTLATRGEPDQRRVLDRLERFDLSSDSSLKTFSGTAIYEGSINLPKASCGGRLLLDLGDMSDVAEVAINGTVVGTVWARPARIEITGHATPGSNRLRISVANLWKNRLVADAQAGRQSAASYYEPGAPLLPAGLVGPIQVLQSCSP